MKVFISWSGTRSKALAIQLHEWLKAIIQRAEPWMSDRDIEAGQRWNEEISARLKETQFGIICLTPENVEAPWLLFEAGALAKAVESARVVPVLLGLGKADLAFPLGQFHAVETDRDGFLALASAVNRAIGDNELSPNVLSNLFDGLWPALEEKLRSIRHSGGDLSAKTRRSDREVLEDVLESVRMLQRSVGDGVPVLDHPSLERGGWEDYYIRGVNMANRRGGTKTNMAAIRSYNEAILIAPSNLTRNSMSRLYTYRAALFKRLNRLEEAENDLILAQKWAENTQEVEDAMYNMACVKAMSGQTKHAIEILEGLVSREPSWREIIRHKTQYFANLQDLPAFRTLVKMA